MDILIDLIVWIIKSSSAARKPGPNAPAQSQQEINRQKAEVEKRIREMQSALTKQGALKPKPGRPGIPLPKPARKAKRAAKQPAPALPPAQPVALQRWTEPLSTTTDVAPKHETASLARKNFIVPILIGEILAPPLALREAQF